MTASKEREENLIYDKIHQMAFLLLGNYHDAWDLAQEVFCELEKGREKWEQADSKTAWAMAVFHRQFRRFLRLQSRNKVIPIAEEWHATADSSAEDRAIVKEQVQQTFASLQDLNKNMAEALLLASLEKMPIKEIARLQGVSEGTVKWRIFEARRQIAQKSRKRR